jgi:predicted nucleotidyltransferase
VTGPDAVETARALVAERYPRARQAWLSGSVVLGGATDTSDLDITVLLKETRAHRESLHYRGWPVELFVHTESSVRHFVAQDLARRRPTMARLVSTGIPLVAGEDGAALREECAAAVVAGPQPLGGAELALARYCLTDQLDDLVGGGSAGVLDAAAFEVWRGTAELLLAAAEWWSGTGKWLIREVEALDAARGTAFAVRLHEGLHEALRGEPAVLVETAHEVLDQVGGRIWAGFRQSASMPDPR